MHSQEDNCVLCDYGCVYPHSKNYLNAMINTDFKFGEVHQLLSQVEPAFDKVQFKNILENANGGVALVAFKEGQKLDEHLAPAEVMVCVLEGEVEFTMIDRPNIIKTGQFLLMGQDVKHSVTALKDSKLLLIKIKP